MWQFVKIPTIILNNPVVSLSVGVQIEDIHVAVVVYEAACLSAYNTF